MSLFKSILASALICVAAAGSISAQGSYVPTPQNVQSRQEFDSMRFGIFIHWGIYSMLGQGEWVQEVSQIPYSEYSKLADGFCPSKFSADEWVDAIKSSGAKYITITSRHHDGFSMFDTKQSSYKITNTPFGRDVLKELSEACQKKGIRLHFYYSHLDWGRDDYYPIGRTGHASGRSSVQPSGSWSHYLSFMDEQLKELLTGYGPIGAIWFDGIWDKDEFPREEQPKIWNFAHQYELIHSLQPSCLVGNNHHLVPFDGEDIQIFERDVPGHNEAGYSADNGISTIMPLETCQTMNGSWGYRITDKDYKSTADLIHLLAMTSGKGANLLLNIGPRPDGTLPDEAVQRLHEMGQWLSRYGESIYSTDGGPTGECEWGVSTKKGNVLYLHVINQISEIVLDGMVPAKNKLKESVSLDGDTITVSRDKKTGKMTVKVPENLAGNPDYVIRLTFQNNI
ncbi:MAG: alpha-L-fucosidase [Bacteroidales bacterium]|nr:alpha-L-fucosidase [Bacteroidales bacterium]